MGLGAIRQGLGRELRSAASMRVFQEARARHEALAAHEMAFSVLGVLNNECRGAYPEKERLTRALVCEHQERPHSLWASLLLAGYFPMLARLRGRVRGDALDSTDLDQLIVATFLDAVATFPLDERRDRTAMYLRQTTQRAVFDHVRLEQREQELVQSTPPEELGDVPPGSWPGRPLSRRERYRRPGPAARARQRNFLHKYVGADIAPDRLEFIEATVIGKEKIPVLIDRRYPGLDPEDRRALHQRLKRQKSRLMAELRELLADGRCPLCQEAGFVSMGDGRREEERMHAGL